MADRLTKFGDTISGIEDFIETPYYKNLDDSDKGIIEEGLNMLNDVLEQVDNFFTEIDSNEYNQPDELEIFVAIIEGEDLNKIKKDLKN